MSRPPKRQRRWTSGDRIFFFPSIGIPVDDGWQVEVHAWCYRLRSHRVVVPLVRKALGQILAERGQYDKAIEQLQKTAEMDANWYSVHLGLGLAYESKGSFPQKRISTLKPLLEKVPAGSYFTAEMKSDLKKELSSVR